MSIILHKINAINSFADLLSSKCLLRLLLLLVVGLTGSADHAQTTQVKIKLVDGRNGRPMAGICVYVWVGNNGRPPTDRGGLRVSTETDKNGSINLSLISAHGEVNNKTQQLSCGAEGVINPVFEYSDTISVRPGKVFCQQNGEKNSWLTTKDFSTDEALKHGVVTSNTCGKAIASPSPGEIVFFVRPLTFFEKLKQ